MKSWIIFCCVTFISQTSWAADLQATLQWSQRVELTTPVPGVIREVNVDVGERVKKGQVLLSLDSTIYQAKIAQGFAEITRLKAEAEEGKRDLERALELHERSVASTTELDQAKLRVVRGNSLLAEAKARQRQNQKALDDTVLRSPFDAVVVLRQAEPGQSVVTVLQPQMLLTLARSREMIAHAQLTAAQVDKLSAGQSVTVNVSGKDYSGKIKTLGLEPTRINDESTYSVEVLFGNTETLRAGASVQLKLP